MSPRFRHRTFLSALLLCAAGCVAYHNSLHGPFVFDDASSIVTNPTIRQLWPLTDVLAGPQTNVTAQGRPLFNFSLALNYAFGGTAVEGYHVGNLVIHLLAGLTLFGIVRRVWPRVVESDGTLPALAAAVLWTVHPLQTESVTYIIQRAESLVGLFYLLTFYCFVRSVEAGRDRGARRDGDFSNVSGGPSGPALPWQVASVISCLLGMATKEVMATAPLMLLFFDRTFFAGSFLDALRRRKGFYLALAGTWILFAWLLAGTGGNRGGSVGFGVSVGWVDYWLTQFQAIGRYLWLTIWPHPLVFEYGAFWIKGFDAIALQVGVVFGLLALTIVALWRRTAFGFLGAWFFGILAPTSLAPGTTQMIVEHRMYLPLAALIVAGVAGAQRLLARSPPASLHAAWWFGGVAVALTLLTVSRNDDYRSELALWGDTIVKRPNNPLAHFMLAGAQEQAGQLAAALASYRQTLELKPDFSIGHEKFGELLLRQGRRTEAIGHFESALRLQPEYVDAHAHLGNAYFAEGRIAEALGHLERAVQLAPDSAPTRYQFGNALTAAGLPADAIAEYETALKLKPGVAAVHYNLGNALVAADRRSEAIAQYEAAVRAQPDYAEAHHNLGSALFELGRLDEAAQHYSETLRLQPDFPNARENLARVLARKQPGRNVP